MYIAVVFGCGSNTMSNRKPHGDWSCFIHENKEAAIKKATIAVKKWNEEVHRNSPYRILVGELTEEVSTPIEYELVPIT